MFIDTALLKTKATALGITLDEVALTQFDLFATLLLEWSKKMNLTTILEPREIVEKHFIDSLSLLTHVEIPLGASLIDVGTGAGFPGVALLIARPDLKLTLLDSLQKRLLFLEAVLQDLGLEADLVHSRGEDGSKHAHYREQFDFATARAVANLSVLAEYCLPYVKVGGAFIAMKGRAITEELSTASKAIAALGGGTPQVFSFDLDGIGERNIILIEKISQTSSIYPRSSAKIAKKPL